MSNDNPALAALAPGSLGVELSCPPDRKGFDWNSVDWTRSNREIAEPSGLSYLTVAIKRRSLGIEPTRRWQHSKYSDYPWETVDWSKSNNELSRRTGLGIGVIRNYRIKLGKPKPDYHASYRGESVKVTDDMIRSADWEFSRDQDLALKWGVSRERIRQIRQAYGKPSCRFKHLTGKLLECLRWICMNKPSIEGMHLSEVLPLLPSGTRQVKIRAIRKSGVRIDWTYSHPTCNPHVRIMNWDLPNVALKMIWTDFGPVNGIAMARLKYSFGRSKWDLRWWKHRKLPGQLLDAIAAEIVKAKSAGVSPDEAAVAEWIKAREGYRP